LETHQQTALEVKEQVKVSPVGWEQKDKKNVINVTTSVGLVYRLAPGINSGSKDPTTLV
jgi:hypothetical protein